MDVSVRLIHPGDAETLSRLEIENRDHLLAGGPIRSDEYVSVAGQQEIIARMLETHRSGTCVPFVIEADGELVGRITLNGIVRGALQSASVGYWVAESAGGRGLASRALGLTIEHAFGQLRLHRLQAETTLTNEASSRILIRAGFEQYGVARDYLCIGGRWRDHRMFQRLNDAWEESDPAPVR
jgi:[ribosomal protein S5]-alanine N-acetyltransferase